MPSDMAFLVGEINDQQESWKVRHNEVQDCWALEDLLRKGIALFQIIRVADCSWSKKVQSGAVAFDGNVARQINSAYVGWLTPCDWISGELAKIEIKYRVEGAEQFRDCVRSAKRSVAIDIERLIESIAQKRAGHALPLDEGFWNAISGNHTRRAG